MESFFDETYLAVWAKVTPLAETEADADALMALLGLKPGDRILDAPCGYGRMASALAARGMLVTGIDRSEALLAHAREQGRLLGSGPTYRLADLRQPLGEGLFDVALNLFSSLGYDGKSGDLQILASIFQALRPGGRLFIDTMHRDAIVSRHARGEIPGVRSGGLTIREKSHLDPITGVIDTTWTWNSPTVAGTKRASIRIYSITELIDLVEAAGFSEVVCYRGISATAFDVDAIAERVGLLCHKPAKIG